MIPTRARPGRRRRTAARRPALLAALTFLAATAGTALPVAAAEATPTPHADQVLIRYAPGASAAARERVLRDHGLDVLASDPDGRTQVVVARGRSVATVRRTLADDPAIAAVGRNERRAAAVDPADEPGFDIQWGMHNSGQRVDGVSGLTDIDIDGLQALGLETGDPDIVVAVIDEGIDFSHPDLADRAWTNPGEAGAKATNGIDDDGNGYIDDVHGWDFCHDDNTLHDAGEDEHGTHVAGTIAASLDGTGVVGVAPGIQLMSLKFLDGNANGSCGYDDQAIEAIDYAASFGVSIINASWGGTGQATVLEAAIAESGALFVAAAGNAGIDMDGTGIKYYPAASTVPNVISVGAADQSGRRASFSNYGKTSVDIAAPGTNIISTWPPVPPDCAASCYAFMEGTSMAAPFVAGAAALAASASRSLLDDPIRLRARLLSSGQSLPNGTTWTASGRMVNAYRAVDNVPPVVTAPNRFTVRAGATVTTTSATINVAWPAATDTRSPIDGYTLVRKDSKGTATLATETKLLEVPTRLTFARSTLFRLTAKDAPRNSTTVSSPTIVVTPYSEGSSLVKWSGSWKTVSSTAALGGKTRYAASTGASATFTINGRSFGLVSSRSSTRGAIKVYVDGTLKATIDLKRSTTQQRVVVFSTGWTTSGKHTIRIVTTSSRRVDVDGFVVVR